MPEFTIANFSKGFQRDAALDPERFFTAYTLENYDIDEIRGELVKRKGSARNLLHTVEPKQVHHFIDASQNEWILVVDNGGDLYAGQDGGSLAKIQIDGSSDHNLATPPYPFVNTGLRCFFSDEDSWYWVSHISLGSTKSYKTGLDRITSTINSSDRADPIDNIIATGSLNAIDYGFNSTTQQKIAQSFKFGFSQVLTVAVGSDTTLNFDMNHQFIEGQSVDTANFVGNATLTTALNGTTSTVTNVIDANSIEISADTTGGTYTSGGDVTLKNAVYLFDSVWVHVVKSASTDTEGKIRIRIETDSSGSPSGTLIDATNGESFWRYVDEFPAGGATNHEFRRWRFPDVMSLSPGTLYWMVGEADDSFKQAYSETPISTHAVFARESAGSGTYTVGSPKIYDGTTWSNPGTVTDISFKIGGGLIAGAATQAKSDVAVPYKYSLSLYDSTHVIEGRTSADIEQYASPKTNIIVNGTNYTYDISINTIVLDVSNVALSGSADQVALYRTDTKDASVDTFRLLHRFVPTSIDYIYDYVYEGFLSSNRQSVDNFRLRNKDAGEESPEVLVFFKNRLWATVTGEDTIYYSKKLPDKGALGVTGDRLLDVFPADNKLETFTDGQINGLRVLPILTEEGYIEVLVIYYDNAISIITGANDSKNPVEDLKLQNIVSGRGLISKTAVTDLMGTHAFMAKDGIYLFNGTSNIVSITDQRIRSVLDTLSQANKEKSIFQTSSEGLWVALDDDSDGTLEAFYIFETSVSVPRWKTRRYNFNINDFIVRGAGDNRSQVLVASDISDFDLRELDTSDEDRDGSNAAVNITGIYETQPFGVEQDETRKRSRAVLDEKMFFHHLDVLANYPTTTLPTYTITITDQDGTTTTPSMAPSQRDDQRGHRTGFRVLAYDARFKVQQASQNQDRIRQVKLSWR